MGRLLNKCDGVKMSSYLKDGRSFIPLLSLRALPGAEQREADFSTMVEVRVEPDYAIPGGPKINHRRLMRIFRWEVDVELVHTTGVRGILGPETNL